MPFDKSRPIIPCPLCGSSSNDVGLGARLSHFYGYNCERCGDFAAARSNLEDWSEDKRKSSSLVALASHLCRQLASKGISRAELSSDFFASLASRTLPKPSEAANNLVLWLGDKLRNQPGSFAEAPSSEMLAIVGLVTRDDFIWMIKNVERAGLIADCSMAGGFSARLTFDGWERFESLKRERTDSRYAFFARKVDSHELETVFTKCLFPAVSKTGYELRKVPQKAGLIDAIIESEIRNSKFLIADLSDDNGGAYWEAGLAEGLGKHVIYVCKSKNPDGSDKTTHFDTSHRQTIRWSADPTTYPHTGAELKAVIRNTLLGDAKQADD